MPLRDIRFCIRLLAAVGLVAVSPAGCTDGTTPPPTYRTPVLETVVLGDQLVPQDAQGNFRALPTSGLWLRLRLWGDINVKVSVDGAPLTRRHAAPEEAGWFEPIAHALTGGSRGLFWEVVVKLPTTSDGGCSATLAVDYDSTRTDVTLPPPLTIPLIQRPQFAQICPALPALASDVFDDGDNSKPDGRATSQIVGRGVVLAGWLFEGAGELPATPQRNDCCGLRTGESEDFHYDLWLDNEFIVRNYGGVGPINPQVLTATIPGAPVPLIRGSSPIPLTSGGLLNAGALTLPGSNLFTVELNAWHIADRGTKPLGWVDDPDPDHSGNAWSFHPTRTLGISSSDPDLKAGDYVIVSGTLWEDTSHASEADEIGLYRKCWDNKFSGHAGWLEIHSVDSVRKVDSPALRKHVEMRGICGPFKNSLDEYIAPIIAAPSENSFLVFEVQVDPRFTHSQAAHTEGVDPNCPDRLHVTASVPAERTFKATYVLWWEEGAQPRDKCSLIIVPAISPFLGPAYGEHE